MGAFKATPNSYPLSDIDECASAQSCDHGKGCINTRGGFECVCQGTQYGPECQYRK